MIKNVHLFRFAALKKSKNIFFWIILVINQIISFSFLLQKI